MLKDIFFAVAKISQCVLNSTMLQSSSSNDPMMMINNITPIQMNAMVKGKNWIPRNWKLKKITFTLLRRDQSVQLSFLLCFANAQRTCCTKSQLHNIERTRILVDNVQNSWKENNHYWCIKRYGHLQRYWCQMKGYHREENDASKCAAALLVSGERISPSQGRKQEDRRNHR